MPESGSLKILKKDPGGSLLAGASFTVLDTNGKEIASGKTGTDGQLLFADLNAGIYRLKETASGSTLHDVVADQDVVITSAKETPLTIVDPFKPGEIIVKKIDKTSGTPLAGAVINLAPKGGKGDPLTLTTGKDGTAKGQLPVTSRDGTTYTATETKAPTGYQLDAKPVTLTVKPGASVTAAFADTAKEKPPTPPVTPEPTKPGTTPPVTPPIPPKETPGTPSPATPTPNTTQPARPKATPTPEGSLAQTGADLSWWISIGAGLLLAAGGGAVFAARRRADGDTLNDPNDKD